MQKKYMLHTRLDEFSLENNVMSRAFGKSLLDNQNYVMPNASQSYVLRKLTVTHTIWNLDKMIITKWRQEMYDKGSRLPDNDNYI